MKNFKILLIALFISFIGYSQTIEITESTAVSGLIEEYKNIHFFTVNQDILISGLFISRNKFISPGTHNILITPSENYSIRIVSIAARDTKGVSTKIVVKDDDKEETDDNNDGGGSRIINIFPNPVRSNLTIETNKKIKKLEIFNTYGIKQKLLNKSKIIDLKAYTKGIYLLKIHLENNQIITKIIIKN